MVPASGKKQHFIKKGEVTLYCLNYKGVYEVGHLTGNGKFFMNLYMANAF
jgi:hypothetical protein